MSIQKTKKPGSGSSKKPKKKPISSGADDEEEDDLDISDLVDKESLKKADELMDKYRERSGE